MKFLELVLKHINGRFNLKISFLLNFIFIGSVILSLAAFATPAFNEPLLVKIISWLVSIVLALFWGGLALGSTRAGLRVYTDTKSSYGYRFWGGVVTLLTLFLVALIIVDFVSL